LLETAEDSEKFFSSNFSSQLGERLDLKGFLQKLDNETVFPLFFEKRYANKKFKERN